jgi:hypothetical protein
MCIFMSFIKVSHPSPYHWITHGMFSIHHTMFTMNVSRFHVSCIQETEYRLHFTSSGLLDFLEHCKHIGWSINADCLHMASVPSQRANKLCMRTIVTAALQRQILQMQLILWISLVYMTWDQ